MADGAVASGLYWVATGKTPLDEADEDSDGQQLGEGRQLTDRGTDLDRFKEDDDGPCCRGPWCCV